MRPITEALHRGTDIAVVATTVVGGMTLSGVPLGAFMQLFGPDVDVPAWRPPAALGGMLIVGVGMLGLAGALRRRRRWARPTAVIALAASAAAIAALPIGAFLGGFRHGVVYLAISAVPLGGLCLFGMAGLFTRGATADFRQASRRDPQLPDPPPPLG
jgi:hypothetical protein